MRASSGPPWPGSSWRKATKSEAWTISPPASAKTWPKYCGQIDLHEADLLDLDALHQACRGVDYVLHEAAIPSVPRSVKDPLGNNRANVDGTLNLLVACRDAKVKRVVYAASSSAYGDTPTLPKREDMPPNPISPYAVAKLASEYYMTSFYRCYGLETVCLRYFNVFGPRQDPTSPYSGVLAKFITQMLRGEPPTIFGDGKQSRDFTYIDNVVSANLLACRAETGKVAGKVINVATGRQTDSVPDFPHSEETDRIHRRREIRPGARR